MNQEHDPQSVPPVGSSNGAESETTPKRKSFKVATKATEPSDTVIPESGHIHITRGATDGSANLLPSNPPNPPPLVASNNDVSPNFEKDENDWHDERSRRGRRPGDRYIRMSKSTLANVNLQRSELSFNAQDETRPMTTFGRSFRKAKRILIGQPLPTSEAQHQRLTKKQALAVLSSDALSSTAYATEEILLVLILTGTASLAIGLPIAFAIGFLLIIVALSYRQTIAAYPKGGGSYIVAKDNLGVTPGLIAAAALLIDYILTVAVSVSAGVAAIMSAIPSLNDYTVEFCIFFIAFITIANLRGVRESGAIFTVPTYLFIVSMSILLILGILNIVFGFSIGNAVPVPQVAALEHTEQLTIFLILRAFSSGCTALTGVEAISDGVPAFRTPEANNARITLSWMAGILVVLFLGITIMAVSDKYKIIPIEQNAPNYETVISQLTHRIVGDSFFYYIVQFTTTMILVLAANTAFSDFPRLSWFLARDRYLPNLFKHQGDRLAYSTGIIALGLLASILVFIFKGSVSALIPLYAVGVFTSFTLSQAGMVVRWWRLRTPGWRKSLILNGMGTLATLIVAVIIAATKFLLGAWIIIALIPILYLGFRIIHHHYTRVSQEVELDNRPQVATLNMDHHTILVPINNLNQVTLRTLSYARALSDEVTAVYVSDSSEAIEQLRELWDEKKMDIPLVAVETPYRSVIGPLMAYIDDLHRKEKGETITVVIPEFVTAKWWQRLLHNQTAFRLKAALFLRPGVVITSVPYHLEK